MINKYKNKQGGEMEFLIIIILFMVGLFIVWVWVGGQNTETVDKPFITPGYNQVDPLRPYDKN